MLQADVDKPRPAPVFAVSSHVVSGSVGLRSAAFALERRGHEVLKMPTIALPWHLGHGQSTPIRPDEGAFAAALEEIADSTLAGTIDAILTGFFASPTQVAATARFIDRVRAERPDLCVLVDPVCGDAGGAYVSAEVAAALRTELLPRADIATPNRFELALLLDRSTETEADCRAAAAALGPEMVVVTSAPAGAGERGGGATMTGALLFAPGITVSGRHSALPGAPHGTGDVFAAIFLSALRTGGTPETALRTALAATFALCRAADEEATDELPFAAYQDVLVAPPIEEVDIRRSVTPAGLSGA